MKVWRIRGLDDRRRSDVPVERGFRPDRWQQHHRRRARHVRRRAPGRHGGSRQPGADREGPHRRHRREGLYRLVDLRPGDYTVTFTLPGFSTFRRDGIELPANFTATVNARHERRRARRDDHRHRRGPVVDIQSTRQQTQFQRETLESDPGHRPAHGLSQVIPGAALRDADAYSVGGVNDSASSRSRLHGAPHVGTDRGRHEPGDGRDDQRRVHLQPAHVPGSRRRDRRRRRRSRDRRHADQHHPARRRQHVLGRDDLQLHRPRASIASNISDELEARGLRQQLAASRSTTTSHWRLGGPIMRDRLWFFGSSGRATTSSSSRATTTTSGKARSFYEPDLSRPAATDQ